MRQDWRERRQGLACAAVLAQLGDVRKHCSNALTRLRGMEWMGRGKTRRGRSR